jgi:hypothetical protein
MPIISERGAKQFSERRLQQKVVALAVKIVSRIAQHERKGVIMVTKKVRCIYGGYYLKEVLMHYDRALSYKPYAQAGVDVDGSSLTLVSYESPIIRYDGSTLVFFSTAPNYSRTTISHVNAFCKEYIPNISYHLVKRMYEANSEGIWKINKHDVLDTTTGEVIEF